MISINKINDFIKYISQIMEKIYNSKSSNILPPNLIDNYQWAGTSKNDIEAMEYMIQYFKENTDKSYLFIDTIDYLKNTIQSIYQLLKLRNSLKQDKNKNEVDINDIYNELWEDYIKTFVEHGNELISYLMDLSYSLK